MTTSTIAVDQELVRAALQAAETYCHGDNHTVAAAARTRDGHIVTGMNVTRFNGGPCAELVVIGTAAARGAYDLDTIVAELRGLPTVLRHASHLITKEKPGALRAAGWWAQGRRLRTGLRRDRRGGPCGGGACG